jgi:hypothetical protein
MFGAADLYRRLVDEHVVPSARARASFGNVAPQEMRPWITGRYAGVHQWVSAIGKSADTLEAGQRIALGAFPLLPNAKDAGLLYRPAMLLAVNRGTRHPQESALLLNFLLNDPEAVRIFEVKRGAPVSKSALRVLEGEGALRASHGRDCSRFSVCPTASARAGSLSIRACAMGSSTPMSGWVMGGSMSRLQGGACSKTSTLFCAGSFDDGQARDHARPAAPCADDVA